MRRWFVVGLITVLLAITIHLREVSRAAAVAPSSRTIEGMVTAVHISDTVTLRDVGPDGTSRVLRPGTISIIDELGRLNVIYCRIEAGEAPVEVGEWIKCRYRVSDRQLIQIEHRSRQDTASTQAPLPRSPCVAAFFHLKRRPCEQNCGQFWGRYAKNRAF